MNSTSHFAMVMVALSLVWLSLLVPFGHGLVNNNRSCRIGFVLLVRGGNSSSPSSTKKSGGGTPLLSRLRFFRRLFAKLEEEQHQVNLQEQIRILEASIRRAKEETRQLRSQLDVANSRRNKRLSSDVHESRQLEEAYRSEIDKLLQFIQGLEETRDQLLQALEVERKLLVEQQTLLEKERSRVSTTERQAKEQLELLKKSLSEESHTKIQALEVELKKQSSADIRNLEEEWKKKLLIEESQKTKEYEQELLGERRKVQQAMDEEKQRSQEQLQTLETQWKKKNLLEEAKKAKEFEQKIREERCKGEEAVEKEKVKMRKLVKALAEREDQEEAKKASLIQKNLASTTSLSGNGSSKSWAAWKQNKGTANVVRGVTSNNSR